MAVDVPDFSSVAIAPQTLLAHYHVADNAAGGGNVVPNPGCHALGIIFTYPLGSGPQVQVTGHTTLLSYWVSPNNQFNFLAIVPVLQGADASFDIGVLNGLGTGANFSDTWVVEIDDVQAVMVLGYPGQPATQTDVLDRASRRLGQLTGGRWQSPGQLVKSFNTAVGAGAFVNVIPAGAAGVFTYLFEVVMMPSAAPGAGNRFGLSSDGATANVVLELQPLQSRLVWNFAGGSLGAATGLYLYSDVALSFTGKASYSQE